MGTRLNLQEELEKVGVSKVYFQPPESIRLVYPCIIYRLSSIDKRSADNLGYMVNNRYEVTLIDYDPDSQFVKKLLQFKHCRLDRPYQADNLNHWSFELYY